MIKIPPNPCTQCYADYSATCHEQCEEITAYKIYRDKIQRLVDQGYCVIDAVEIVNEQYRRKHNEA